MTTPETEALHQLVDKYRVSWSTTPERAVLDGELRAIGWNLELCATHGDTVHEATPGCPACPPVVDALERIVRFILPTEPRRSHYEVHVSTTKIQYSHAHSGFPEMAAVITILHNEGINDPIDACEKRCLDDMTTRLHELGSRERQ